jgi:hypothetical protein
VGWTTESENDRQRVERCDHAGTTEPLNGLTSVSVCKTCGKTWPTRFGVGSADRADRVEARRCMTESEALAHTSGPKLAPKASRAAPGGLLRERKSPA